MNACSNDPATLAIDGPKRFPMPQRCAFAAALLFCTALVSSACASDDGAKKSENEEAPPPKLKRMFMGPLFVTNDPERPEAAAVIVNEDGTIEKVLGELPRKLQGYAFVRLEGALAVPGLHDAHAHIEGVGKNKEDIDLRGTTSIDDLRMRIQTFAEAHPDVRVIQGRGWDQSLFEGKAFPTAKDIDAATDRPLLVRRVDGHAALANTKMQQLANITAATKAPEGGRILVDEHGGPTGVFVDNAMDLLFAHLPVPTLDDRKRWLRTGMHAFADAGVVAVHDMGMGLQTFEALQALDAEGPLPVRVFVYLDGSAPDALNRLKESKDGNRYRVMGLKHLIDGAMGSRGAALLDEYSDEPGTRGLLLMPPEKLTESVRNVDALGKHVAVHAIGDRGIRLTLDAIAAGQSSAKGNRHRIEHAQLVHPDDVLRFGQEQVIASMQPTHATSDMRWVEKRVGPDRMKGAYAWRTFLQAKVPLAFGSDAPVESERVVLGLHAAITRQDREGQPENGFMPEQRVTANEAIHAFSAGAAFAVKQENTLGVLKPGAQFDLSVFDIDPRADAAKWLTAKPLATYVAGEERGGAEFDTP